MCNLNTWNSAHLDLFIFRQSPNLKFLVDERNLLLARTTSKCVLGVVSWTERNRLLDGRPIQSTSHDDEKQNVDCGAHPGPIRHFIFYNRPRQKHSSLSLSIHISIGTRPNAPDLSLSQHPLAGEPEKQCRLHLVSQLIYWNRRHVSLRTMAMVGQPLWAMAMKPEVRQPQLRLSHFRVTLLR